jgi:ankyrin repeat protein
MITQLNSKTAPATFDHLPLHLQSHIFTLSTAPPDTCKVAAAITEDLQLAAQWLLTKHKYEKEPLYLLRTAAECEHWRLCAWAVQHKRYWSTGDLNKALLAATRAGQVDLVRLLLQQQGGWAGWLWTEPQLQPYCAGRYERLLATKPDLEYIDDEVEDLMYEESHPLVEAVEYGHKELFALFLEQGVNIQAAGEALEIAAGEGHTDLVQMLLTKMPRVVRQLEAVRAAVCAAAGAGHLSAIQLLILYAPGVKQPGLGPNPLVSAALGGHLHVMRFLLRGKGIGSVYGYQHCEWSSPDNRPSPCEAAATGGSVEALQLLLANGYSWQPEQWVKALEGAARNGHVPVIKMLLGAAASGAVWVEPHQYRTALWEAAGHGRAEAVQLLLKDVANPEELVGSASGGSLSRSALHAASAAGSSDVVQIILQRCKRRRDLDCHTAFRLAAGSGCVPVLELLDGKGGVNVGDEEYGKNAPLEAAIRSRNINVVTWLLEQGAKANQQALLDALEARCQPILALLLEHGVEDVGDRALYVAAQLGDIHSVEWLLSAAHGKQQQAGTQAVSTRMEVALCGAASRGRVKLGEWLLKRAAAAAAAASATAAAAATTGAGQATVNPGATALAGVQSVAGAAHPAAQLVPEQPGAAATGADSANPGATATDAAAPPPVPLACAYTPAMLNKALEAVIMKSRYKYPHPDHPQLSERWRTPGWVRDTDWAGHRSHTKFARLLVKAGADTQSEEYGKLVLRALELERFNVFHTLMEAGPVPAVIRGGQALKGLSFNSDTWRSVFCYTDPSCANSSEYLQSACNLHQYQVSIIHMLLKRGADVNYNNGAPLKAAMWWYRAHSAALLLLHGAHVEESQVEWLHRMAAEEEGGAQLARALEVRGIHLKPPATRNEGPEAAQAPHVVQAV